MSREKIPSEAAGLPETPPQTPIHVLIDDRERGCEAATALIENPEVHCEFKRLKTGDYAVEGLVVERKTLRDFAVSILDGRLFRQAERLAACSRPLLILEGKAEDLSSCGIRREALQGALITVSLLYGIPVLRASDGQETARLILYAAHQMRRIAMGVQRHGRRPRGKRAAQMRLLQGLPHIGPGRAATLLSAFDTVLGTLQATTEELETVKGIGPKVAQGIVWAVREQGYTYQHRPLKEESIQ